MSASTRYTILSVRHIRPYQLFALVEKSPAERVVTAMLPARRGAGGTSLLETFLLIAGCKAVNACRIFEFGTFMGTNAFDLALNTPEHAEIFTLDLPDSDVVQHHADLPLAEMHLSANAMDFTGHPVERKIRRLTGNSRQFDYSAWRNSIDFVFIDGGHDAETVKSDSDNAFALVATGRPSCIMWHDYGNHDYPELTAYLEHLSESQSIIHIEDTTLCALFSAYSTPFSVTV